MSFYNRFRKPQKDASAQAEPSGQGEAMSKGAAAESGAAESPGPAPQSETAQSDAAPQVKEVSVEELKARIDAGTAPLLIDVREPWEHQIASIATAVLMPMNSIPGRMDELDKQAEIIVHCHHGQRSWNVAAYMLQHGFTNVKNLTGGIDSWARRVDRSMRTY